MRIMSVHADFIEVEVKKKAIEGAEEIKDKRKRYEEVLVVFVAVEEGDSKESAKLLAEESRKIAAQLHTDQILLYPLVHLTSNPAPPSLAKEMLLEAEKLLSSEFKVDHAPFGWYKSYTIRCKGHPLSELSREFKAGTQQREFVPESLQKESAVKSSFYVMESSGTIVPVEEYQFKNDKFRFFVDYEIKKSRVYEKEPPHIKLMRAQQLIDYEPGSDPGNFRFLPKGRLMKKLLEQRISDICVQYGALEVETPIMYDFEHPALKKYLNRFPARQYIVLSDKKKLFLRFAACFGQFLIAHDMTISYKHLPLKLFELTRYSFRREQSGELAGLKRLRAFTMPDMHTLVSDFEMAKKEFERQYELCLEWNRDLGIETEIAFRVQEDFFNENKEWYVSLVKKAGRPVLFEIFKERYAYFITKFEFNFVDCMHKASALSTVQIDVENAETYDISYVDEEGRRKRPLILHASISGSLERVLYALLEREAERIAKGQKASWPLWLSPTQVRILPLSNQFLEEAKALCDYLTSSKIRADIDDRDETLSKKVREAEKEWVPYVVVIGEREAKEGTLSVNVRGEGRVKMKREELAEEIKKRTDGYPYFPLSLPLFLSKRPLIA